MPPSGEALRILAGNLGNRVYTKYAIALKHRNKKLEKLGNIYKAYAGMLAKDTEVTKATRLGFCWRPVLSVKSVLNCFALSKPAILSDCSVVLL